MCIYMCMTALPLMSAAFVFISYLYKITIMKSIRKAINALVNGNGSSNAFTF